jgi:hypothetical protein
LKNALKDIPIPEVLRDGIHVLRVYANGQQTHPCYLTLSDDNFTLYVNGQKNGWQQQNESKRSSWFGRSKSVDTDERAIDIGAIHRIQRGHGNRRFEKMARKHRQTSSKSLLGRQSSSKSLMSLQSPQQQSSVDNNTDMIGMNLNPSQCFSIIFRGDWTLDLMMMNNEDDYTGHRRGGSIMSTTTDEENYQHDYGEEPSTRDKILDALDRILQRYAEQKSKVSNDVLLLRYVWLDADKVSTCSTLLVVVASVSVGLTLPYPSPPI